MTEKEKTAPVVSVGADTEQSILKQTDNSITDFNEFDKGLDNYLEEMQKEFLQQLDPSHLKTVSMSELYNTVYQSKPPLIDGLLYPGTYIFAGAPKLGKSFLMAQLAYHISTGTSLWNFDVKKGTVLYLALEDDYHRLQERLYRMFGTESTDNLYFSVSAGQLGNGLDEQLTRFMTDDKFDRISGTNGLLGAADGGFILRKEKRTSNSATLEVSGRDQPDQKIYLNRNPETLVWELERTETELWKLPPEPLLENIAVKITNENPEWYGSPTELVEFLGVDMKANALTMKLNINAGRLFNEYGISYQNKRCHDGRKVSLTYEQRDDV